MIRLGFCLDLLDPYNVKYIKKIKESYCDATEKAGLPIPANMNHKKFLDCAVFQYAYTLLETEENVSVDSARAVYVPTGKDKRIWERSWISDGAHIQICVRKPACILGTWLHYPTELGEENDDQEKDQPPEINIEPEASGGGAEVRKDVTS